jgi:hypothetical protein
MANPSQSQDVEYKGPKSNPLGSRHRRQSRDSPESAAPQALDREAEPGAEQPEVDDPKLSQHGSNTPSRAD